MVWLMKNQRVAKQVFANWAVDFQDPLMINYFFKKSVALQFEPPPHYHYYWLTFCSVGVFLGFSARYFLCSPQTMFRPLDKRREPLDRWKLNLYSLPYFNHWLRNYSVTFINSFVDNEPDWTAHHPWGIRPTRSVAHRRYPTQFCNSYRYFIDDPNYDDCLHKAVEKRYEAIGYYVDRKPKPSEEKGEEE